MVTHTPDLSLVGAAAGRQNGQHGCMDQTTSNDVIKNRMHGVVAFL